MLTISIDHQDAIILKQMIVDELEAHRTVVDTKPVNEAYKELAMLKIGSLLRVGRALNKQFGYDEDDGLRASIAEDMTNFSEEH